MFKSADLGFAYLPILTLELLKLIIGIAVQQDNCFSFSGVTCLAASGSAPWQKRGECPLEGRQNMLVICGEGPK